MRYGVAIFLTEDGLEPRQLARLVESRGFDSLFLPEHTHIPIASRYTFPWGESVPPEYARIYDPFVALTAIACETSTLRVGTGICLVSQHDPLVLAKTVATLDRVSDGRFIFGVGAGWNVHEMANHGVDPARRFARMRECIKAMRAIWSSDEATFHGEFVNFERIESWPKPIQRPHPPILLAGNGPRAVDRVLDYGDGWLPEPEDGIFDRIRELVAHAEDRRTNDEPLVTLYSAEPEMTDEASRAGVGRCVFWLPPRPAKAIEREIDRLAVTLAL